MNPHWIRTIHQTIKKAVRTCSHCGRKAVYPQKQAGQFHTCKHCHRRFKETKDAN